MACQYQEAMHMGTRRYAPPGPVFLFSIDLEDVRTMIPEGEGYCERVPATVAQYLDLLERYRVRCTFFTVGNVARRYPMLIREIVAAGHEIACHSSEHRTLNHHSRDSFRADLQRSLGDLADAGADQVCGFRAPMLSLTAESAWAYDVLAEAGFTYSSSVLPARSPLFGWPGFPRACTLTPSGVWELPLTLSGLPAFNVPFAGGVYFRLLPFAVLRRFFRQHRASDQPVVGYFHPYDIDTEQERFMHPEINDSRFLNWLMYCNRSKVLSRLARLLDDGATVLPYAEFVTKCAG